MTRSTLGRDMALLRDLGLDYSAGDRVVTIPRYGGSKSVYWSVNWRLDDRWTASNSGVSPTRALAVKAIRTTVLTRNPYHSPKGDPS